SLSFRNLRVGAAAEAGPPGAAAARIDTAAVAARTISLSGVLRGEGRLPPDTLPELTARVDLEPTPVGDGRLELAVARLDVRGGRADLEAVARTGSGLAVLLGDAELTRDDVEGLGLRRASVRADVDLPDLHLLVGRDSARVEARLDVS